MDSVATDRVVILGAGLAALTAALRLAPHPVLLISPENLGQGASSAWAQGGIAAAMDPADKGDGLIQLVKADWTGIAGTH